MQFARDPETLNQFFRSMTPSTGPFDMEVISDAVSALFDKVGPGTLVTHSQSGGPGWLTVIKNPNVALSSLSSRAAASCSRRVRCPLRCQSAAGPLEAIGIPMTEFMRLTKLPIVIYYGDNIPDMPTPSPGRDNWRVRVAMARLWRDAVNRYGGDVTFVHLPEIGITGNTHFAFSDTNNQRIAELMAEFLREKRLD